MPFAAKPADNDGFNRFPCPESGHRASGTGQMRPAILPGVPEGL